MPTVAEKLGCVGSIAAPIVGGVVGGIASGPEGAFLGAGGAFALATVIQATRRAQIIFDRRGVKNPAEFTVFPLGEQSWYRQEYDAKADKKIGAISVLKAQAALKIGELQEKKEAKKSEGQEIIDQYIVTDKAKERAKEVNVKAFNWSNYNLDPYLSRKITPIKKEIDALDLELNSHYSAIEECEREIKSVQTKRDRLLALAAELASFSARTPDHVNFAQSQRQRLEEKQSLEDYFNS